MTKISLRTGIVIASLCAMPFAHGSTTSHAAKHSTHKRTASLHSTASQHSRRHRARHNRAMLGQQTMDSGRATEIQQALIQAHYLDGSPTGQWDASTQAAMVKYQTDNGWQSKITPDSRAIIKLGLGPKQDEGEYAATQTGISKSSEPSVTSDGANATSIVASSKVPPGTQQ